MKRGLWLMVCEGLVRVAAECDQSLLVSLMVYWPVGAFSDGEH